MSSSNNSGRRRLRMLGAAGAALVLAACGSSSDGGSSAGAGSPSEASGGSGSLDGKTVSLVSCADQNQWCRAYNHAIIDGLEAQGVQVDYLQNPYDPVQQAQQLNQAVSQNPDLIVTLATDARAVVPGLRQADAAGVPVINVVGPTVPESEDYYASSVEVNHRQLGENAATLLVEGLQKAGHESGNVIAITGATVQPEVAVRMEGFKDVLSKHPEYKLVEVQDGEWDQVKTANIAQQLFARYADQGGIVGAYGMADQQAAGIIQAAQQAGLTVGVEQQGMVVVASNCFKIGMENIRSGLQYGTSTQAAEAVAEFTMPVIEKFLAGEDVEPKLLTTEERITQENLDEWVDACSVA